MLAQTKEPLADLVNKAIDLSADSTYAEFYFNPLFATDLLALVPSLEKAGFVLESLEAEQDDGLHISAKIKFTKDGSSLNLGELVLTGTGIEVVKERPLQPVVNVVNFVRQKTQGG